MLPEKDMRDLILFVLSQKGETPRWHKHRSIRRRSIITWPPLTTMSQRIITIKLSTITPLASTRRQSNMQLRLTSIVN
jgi:hypothetical protein